MNDVIIDFNEKFKIEGLLICETDYWNWSLRPGQATLGSGILSLKRECPAFSELNQEEFSDLKSIIKIIEETLKKSFGYDIINYLMLMMVDKQVHYHIIPRYKKNIDFNDRLWIDFNWPNLPDLTEEEIDCDMLNKILMTVKENLVL